MADSNNMGQAFKRKAGENFKAAIQLSNASPNAAANRAYYALYHAIIGEFELQGRKPGDVDPLAKLGKTEEEQMKWRHSVVINNGSLAGLNARERPVLRMAFDLRVRADYNIENVSRKDLEPLLHYLPNILIGLGVKIL